MAPNREDFQAAPAEVLVEAAKLGLSFIGLKAGALHRRVGGYPGTTHRMPVCCDVMRGAMVEGDEIVDQPPRGDGATLPIK